MRKIFKESIKSIFIVCFGIVFFFLVINIQNFYNSFLYFLRISSPIINAFAMAFVLNILVNIFERKLFNKLKENSLFYKKKRMFSIIFSVLLTFALFITIFAFLIPQFINSVLNFTNELPKHIENIRNSLKDFPENYNIPREFEATIYESINSFNSHIQRIIKDGFFDIAPKTINMITGIASSIFSFLISFLISFVLAIYMLLDKEKLIRNLKRFLHAFLKKEHCTYLIHVTRVFNNSFQSFVQGQVTESIILGFLCFVGMTVLGFNYSFLISFIIGITCIIPYFGAYIGTIPAFIIMLLSSPQQSLWFLLFAICLQQFEGNIIYPRVVGKSMGLPTIWVSVALILGGNMLGFLGMILGVPVFTSFYILLREYIYIKETGMKDFYLNKCIEKEDDFNKKNKRE